MFKNMASGYIIDWRVGKSFTFHVGLLNGKRTYSFTNMDEVPDVF
jgi:hypothetical protein